MDQAHHTLISLLLPEGILEYFDLINVEKDSTGLKIYLEEKNIVPSEYKDKHIESKGFLPETSI